MAKPSGPGELRDRFKFQRRAEGGDGYGNSEGPWQDLAIERWAKKEPTRGGEAVQAARLTGNALFDVWVRCDPETKSLTTDDRAVERIPGAGGAFVDGAAYNIRFGPEDMDGVRTWLLLQVESGVPD
jgi:head-tail adaptor